MTSNTWQSPPENIQTNKVLIENGESKCCLEQEFFFLIEGIYRVLATL
jgi:hypothetical protein